MGIDLFAGAGGLSLGFEQAGFDIRLAVEIDKHAASSYQKNRQDQDLIMHSDDISKLSTNKILKLLGIKKGELDIVIGGPPCQGFSTSNTMTRNLDNPKNYMVFIYYKYVMKLKPKWFVMENVAGLETFNKGSFKEELIRKFSRLGYQVRCGVLNASNFGVPQSRNRIFIIGNNVGNPMTFFDSLLETKLEKPVTVMDAISDLPVIRNGNLVDKKPYRKKNTLSPYQGLMRANANGIVSNNLTTRHSDLATARFKEIKRGENLVSLAERRPDLVTNYSNLDNCHSWIYLRLPGNKPSVAVINYRKNMLIHPTQNRGLSVREAARLQSFPDNYVFHGTLGSQQQQVANSVPPLFAHEIAKLI
jgi:DNA (cytosine-5)-methyltransferase 1